MLAILALVAAASMNAGSDARDVSMRTTAAPGPSITIAALPYARTVTCSSYTLTGTAPGAGAVTWSASPSGASGACTGTSSWSCVVDVDPDAVGEGVETITVAQSGATSATATIGFYVEGEHSCFLRQSVNGLYNSGLVDAAAVATWENLGSSGLDVTQGVGTAQPTFRTSCQGGGPCVRFDGSDVLKASTASDWTFLNTGADATVMMEARTTSSNPNALFYVLATAAVGASTTSRGITLYYDDRSGSSRSDFVGWAISKGSAPLAVSVTSANDDFTAATWHMWAAVLDDDGSTGNDGFQFVDGAAATTYSASDPTSPLALGDEGTARTFAFIGDVGDVLIYSSALTETQRGINDTVAAWASGGDLVASTETWLFVGDSLTAGSGGVTTWPAKLAVDAPSTVHFTNRAASSTTSAQILAQWRAAGVPDKIFVLGGVNDIAVGTSAATAFASLSPIYSEASARGVQVIAMPTLPFGNAASWSAADQTQLLLLEDSIIADTNVDVLVNFYDLMGQPGTPEDLAAIYDNGDGVHPNEAGTTFMADTMATALGL
jgi:lysophospholipase L1-like esterase